ncbi:MAG: DNA primase [Bacteroidales bacterium]|nr:DNA primase [Bacteroidales bacterium]MCF8458636.1 DNA primase [Bacteroidales bacterium]
MIDPTTIDRIFQTAQILDVVQDFIPLKKRGVNYLGLCPFHNEKTPSFTVSPSKGIYKCFGCGKGGSSVNFIMDHENLSYVESLKYLAKKYNIEIEEKELTADDLEKKNQRESLMIVTAFASDYFHKQLLQHEEGKSVGLSYFKERGFRDEIIEKFKLGYCLEERDAFSKAAMAKGYKLEYLTETGLTISKDDWKADRFNGRVVFPVFNIAGRVIAFGGRTLKSDKKIAKYLNSPESDIYHKSHIVYGIFQAKRSILQHDQCYLVEGYTDVISMHQAGIENVVASSGTSLTVDQIRLIKRFTPNITILYDGDEAGIKASIRGIDLILEEGMNVKVLLFPDGVDPDSYARSHNDTELKQFIETNEEDFISFKTRLLQKEAKSDPVKKAQLIKDIVTSIAVIPDKITRSVFIKQTATNIEISEDILYNEVSAILRKKSEKKLQQRTYESQNDVVREKKKTQIPEGTGEGEIFEREILRLMILYGNLPLFEIEQEGEQKAQVLSVAYYIINEIEPQKDILEFRHPKYKEAYEMIEEQMLTNGEISVEALTQSNNPLISSLSADVQSKAYQLSNLWTKKESFVETEEMTLTQLVPETLMSFQQHRVDLLIKESEDKLKEPLTNEDMIEILNKIKTLKSINLSLAKKLGERTIT